MNRMSEIAQILGIKLGEEFKIKGDDYSHFDKYRLTEERLELFANGNWHDVSSTLVCLLNGQAKVVKIPKPILTEKEREYLSYVIKPFRNKIRYIYKFDCFNGTKEYLFGSTKDFGNLEFPSFKRGTMYCGMELCKEYTLEELGL